MQNKQKTKQRDKELRNNNTNSEPQPKLEMSGWNWRQMGRNQRSRLEMDGSKSEMGSNGFEDGFEDDGNRVLNLETDAQIETRSMDGSKVDDTGTNQIFGRIEQNR
uniref:Uncharacterized protein n=1 Tax=Cucumis melo TaxID=3656 RepID=A0A9I9DWA3_CUCME